MTTEHECHICHKIFTRSTILKDHLRSHQNNRAYACTVCSRAFVRNGDRKDHERTHTKDYKYECRRTNTNGTTQGCDARFHRKHDLNRHRKRKGGQKCLLEHPLDAGSLELSQTVEAASTLFSIASVDVSKMPPLTKLPNSQQSLHLTPPPPTREVLPDLRDKSQEPVLPEDDIRPSNSHQHTSSPSYHSRDYGLGFPDPQQLSTLSARTWKYPSTYFCHLCPKQFSRAYNLRSHLRQHTGERPFVCLVCGKAFARQYDRKKHEGLHSGEKKFVCKGSLSSTPGVYWGCGRQFARADALGRHFRSEAGRICIKPLLDEEAAAHAASTAHLSTTSVAEEDVRGEAHSDMFASAVPQPAQFEVVGYLSPPPISSLSEMTFDLFSGYPSMPEALFHQYPQLQEFDWFK